MGSVPDQQAAATNGHTPVSNVPEVGEVVVETQVSQPSEGEAGEVQEQREGIEAVAGHERTEAELARLFTAPDTSTLRPIAEASFGPPPPLAEIVHGPDDRIQITNTAIYPWRVHASLLITAADNSLWIGTEVVYPDVTGGSGVFR